MLFRPQDVSHHWTDAGSAPAPRPGRHRLSGNYREGSRSRSSRLPSPPSNPCQARQRSPRRACPKQPVILKMRRSRLPRMHSGNQRRRAGSQGVTRAATAKILATTSGALESCPQRGTPTLFFLYRLLLAVRLHLELRERAMDNLTISAAGGMQARMESLDMLANNLANTETGGYKTDREFYNLYISAEAGGAANVTATALPVIERPWTDFSQGTLRATGSPLDLALSGKGFFAVDGPSGNLFTRNGNFRISPGGSLVTSEGYPVRTVSGGNLKIEASGALEIS